MRIRTWDELSDSQQAGRIAVEVGAFSWYASDRLVAADRAHRSTSDFVALYAVERGEVVAQVAAGRVPFRTPTGPVEVSAIRTVTTRVDAARRGWARRLLEEAHAREAEAGRAYALLWTSPAWYAHRLYTELGYRDVWASPLALRRFLRPRGPNPFRPARPSELPAIEALHRAATADAVGFAPRPPGHLVSRYPSGLDLSELVVLRQRGAPIAYAVARRGRQAPLVSSGEWVAPPGREPTVLEALERLAAPGVLALGNSPTARARRTLVRGGYTYLPRGEWRVLMARPLGSRPIGGRALAHALGADRPEFACMAFDRF